MIKRLILSSIAAATALPVSVVMARLPNPNFDITTMVNGVPIGLRVDNNLALATVPFGMRVRRSGFAAVGDGGVADFTTTSTLCSLGNGSGDGGSQVGLGLPGAYTGCANVDWSSVDYWARPEMFGTYLANSDNSSMVQAAVNTTQRVLLSKDYYITQPITLSTNDQLIKGLGRVQTGLKVDGNFNLNSAGIIVFTGQPPRLQDFHITGAQPALASNATLSQLIQYPPFIYAESTPRFHMDGMFLASCIVCIDMKGNSGGSYVDDLWMSAYKTGIDIDGSLDTLRFNRVHGYVFYINNTTLQNNNVVWWNIGRIDDLKITDSLSYQGQGFNLYNSVAKTTPYNNNGGGGPTGTVTNYDNDIENLGINCAGGNTSFVGGYFATAQAIAVTGPCNLRVSHQIIPGSSNSINVAYPGSNLMLDDDQIQMNPSVDATAITMSSGQLQIGGTTYFPQVGVGNNPVYNLPKINIIGGRFIMVGVSVGDRAAGGSGNTFVQISTDGFHVVTGNSAPGWNISKPSTGAGTSNAFEGIYGPNAMSAAGPQ